MGVIEQLTAAPTSPKRSDNRGANTHRAEQEVSERRAAYKWRASDDTDIYKSLGSGQVVRKHRKLTRAEQKAASRSKVRPAKDRKRSCST